MGDRPRRRGVRLTVTAMCCAGLAFPALARVQPYQVVRLITFKTECRLEKLEDRSPATGPLVFFGRCENESFYPDGVEVVCADRDDDRSCRATTTEKSFDNLELLRPRH